MSEALVDRLRGIYRIPITDWLGAVGSGEEPDNPNEFVRKFETAPIQHEAADRIEALERERDEARGLVTEANNSLYGSQGYFHSLNGGPYDKYHLASGIENLKSSCRAAQLKVAEIEADKARLSEAQAGLCDWIENEVGAELPFDARAALAGSGSGWRGIYRLLETTDTIQAGDEVIDDDGVTWCPVDRWSIGCEVSRLFKSIRRALPAAPQQGGE